MNRRFKLLLVLVLAISAFAVPMWVAPVVRASSCPVTTPMRELPKNTNTAKYSETWFQSADKKIFASTGGGRFFAGDNKILWERPAEQRLIITGHRLDNPSVTLTASIPDGYQAEDYQSTALTFPMGGCWQVDAKAGDSTITFVLDVLPRFYRPLEGVCADITKAVNISDAIIVGRVEGSTPDRQGFTWLSILEEQRFKGERAPSNRYEVLRDTDYDVDAQLGKSYVFFLQSQPGLPWRFLCRYLPLPAASDGKIMGTVFEAKIETISALESEIKRILAKQ